MKKEEKRELKLEEIEEGLKGIFPHGHKDFIHLTMKEIELHSNKNLGYAGSGPPLGNFYRVASLMENYSKSILKNPEIVAAVYMLKQVDAVLWALTSRYDLIEIEERLKDISVYAKIIILLLRESLK